MYVFTDSTRSTASRQSISSPKNPKTAPNGRIVTKDSGVTAEQSKDKDKPAENGCALHAGHVIPKKNDIAIDCYFHAD